MNELSHTMPLDFCLDKHFRLCGRAESTNLEPGKQCFLKMQQQRQTQVRASMFAHSHTAVGFPGAQTVKNLPAMREPWVWSLGWKDPQRRKWPSTPVFFPGEFHGQRSLVLQSMGSQEPDMTEWLTLLLYTIVRKSIDRKGKRTTWLFQKNGYHWRKLGGALGSKAQGQLRKYLNRALSLSSVPFSRSVMSNSLRLHGL